MKKHHIKRQKYKKNIIILPIIKWFFIFFFLTISIIAYYYFHNLILPIRLLIVVMLMTIAGGIVFTTDKGKYVLSLANEARIELSKIIWPLRQETFYTTVIVAVLTTFMSLILWSIDSILVRLVAFITSLRF